MLTLAPIILFTYNRLVETQQTVEALKNNFLAKESELFIFSDGAKKNESREEIGAIREYLHSIGGFKKVKIYESPINKGLANSVIDGVTEIISEYGKVIVLEDDLITAPNFLEFMNQALNFYADTPNIFSVSGYTFDLKSLSGSKDFYLGYRASSWGWGTWENKWKDVDWKVEDYNKFKWNIKEHMKFQRGGSDLPRMLHKQMKGKIDSWAIRWCFSQYKKNMLTVFPTKSKVISIGFGDSATHTKKMTRFKVKLDNTQQKIFTFENKNEIDQKLVREFKSKFSLITRLKSKIQD